jgi:hypothetical protein
MILDNEQQRELLVQAVLVLIKNIRGENLQDTIQAINILNNILQELQKAEIKDYKQSGGS